MKKDKTNNNRSEAFPSLSASMRETSRKLRVYAWLSLLLSAVMLVRVGQLMRSVWQKPSVTGTRTQ